MSNYLQQQTNNLKIAGENGWESLFKSTKAEILRMVENQKDLTQEEKDKVLKEINQIQLVTSLNRQPDLGNNTNLFCTPDDNGVCESCSS